jgi:hypothetical protein
VVGLGFSAGVIGVLTRRAEALGEALVGIARLEIAGLADPHPGAITSLLAEVAANSSVKPDLTARTVDPASDALFDQPFVVLSGNTWFDPLPDAAVANLRLYLREGGFLFVDDATGVETSDFDTAVRRDLKRILPGTKISTVGRDHAIYRSFFLMRTVSGRVAVRPYLLGMWQGDITPVVYSRNDLLGACARAPGGGWAEEVIPGGESQRREARKLAINLVLFALTSNYKKDAVHVKTLLKRMRRQGGYVE